MAAARRQACQHELELGQRLAPALYRRIVEVRGSVERPSFDGSGPLLDAAIEMHAFHPSQRFDRIAGRGELRAADVSRLAASLARFHREAARAPAGDPRAPERRLRALLERSIHMHGAAGNADVVEWCERELARCAEVLAVRAREGWCRTVHGDMRLAHAARLDHAIALFGPRILDGEGQHDDVATDVSALAADLEAAGHRPFAWRLLNRWSTELADLSAPAVLPLHLVVRHLSLAGAAGAARAAPRLALARAAAYPDPPILILMHGLTGTGKSTVATDLAARLAGFLVRSDAVRKALLGLAPQARTDSSLGALACETGSPSSRTRRTPRPVGPL